MKFRNSVIDFFARAQDYESISRHLTASVDVDVDTARRNLKIPKEVSDVILGSPPRQSSQKHDLVLILFVDQPVYRVITFVQLRFFEVFILLIWLQKKLYVSLAHILALFLSECFKSACFVFEEARARPCRNALLIFAKLNRVTDQLIVIEELLHILLLDLVRKSAHFKANYLFRID